MKGDETGVGFEGNAKTLVGDYHTHGDYSKESDGKVVRIKRRNDEFDSDRFSSEDRKTGRAFAAATEKYRKTRGEKYTRVLGTPSGKIRVKKF